MIENNKRRTLECVAEVLHCQVYCQELSVELVINPLMLAELLAEECQGLSSAMGFLLQDDSYGIFAGVCGEVELGVGGGGGLN